MMPNLGGFFAAQSTTEDSAGERQQLPSQKSNPTPHERLGAPPRAETTPAQGDGARATSVGDAMASRSPRMLALQRIILCFNVLETMDFYAVQQQAVCTIHIYTLVVLKACVFEQYQCSKKKKKKKCTKSYNNKNVNKIQGHKYREVCFKDYGSHGNRKQWWRNANFILNRDKWLKCNFSLPQERDTVLQRLDFQTKARKRNKCTRACPFGPQILFPVVELKRERALL